MNVAELVAKLSALPPEAEVGVVTVYDAAESRLDVSIYFPTKR